MADGITQIAYWNGEVGQRWARNQEVLDAVVASLTDAPFDAADLRPGARVLSESIFRKQISQNYTNGISMHLIAGFFLVLLFSNCSASAAQSLEETALILFSSGAQTEIKRESPNMIVDVRGYEVRIIDETACTVRITDRNRPANSQIKTSWGKEPSQPTPNTYEELYREIYFGRVIPGDIKKVPEILGTRGGIIVEQKIDAKWRLPGSPGDEVWCQFWPDKTKNCLDHIEFNRLLNTRDASDQSERANRVDRAMTRLYGDLCKGSAKRVPF